MARKVSAGIPAFDYHIEIYTSRGKYMTDWSGRYDPNIEYSDLQLQWLGTYKAGKPVPSGYYFLVMTYAAPGSKNSSKRATCLFWVNDADHDKLK